MRGILNTPSVGFEEKINDRLSIIRVQNGHNKNTFAKDVHMGLTEYPKGLHPKYFYDSEGSKLFEQICETPEYYVTRTEAAILERYSNEMAKFSNGKKVMVELGSGSSVKTRYLLSSFIKCSGHITYIPIDVSDILVNSAMDLLGEFESLSIKGIIGEYEEGLQAVNEIVSEPKIIVFLGSSIGNFTPYEARDLLDCISSVMNENDLFLIGFDLVKDTDVLNSAYDDFNGITAKFNLNILKRINDELGGNFDLSKFRHKAFFNPSSNRVEMHLESLTKQDVYIEAVDETIHFEEGETIHTENSYKFTGETIEALASSAGLRVINYWTDSNNYFRLCLMSK